jgi:hypothetical protein
MNENKNTTVSISGLLPTLLGVAFIVLKLVGVIHWSWVWVLSPFWIPLVVALLIFTVLMIILKKF